MSSRFFFFRLLLSAIDEPQYSGHSICRVWVNLIVLSSFRIIMIMNFAVQYGSSRLGFAGLCFKFLFLLFVCDEFVSVLVYHYLSSWSFFPPLFSIFVCNMKPHNQFMFDLKSAIVKVCRKFIFSLGNKGGIYWKYFSILWSLNETN